MFNFRSNSISIGSSALEEACCTNGRTFHSLRDDGRAPFCAVIGCADLRTPVERIFDSSPGEIFVLRNAGNTITHAQGGHRHFRLT